MTTGMTSLRVSMPLGPKFALRFGEIWNGSWGSQKLKISETDYEMLYANPWPFTDGTPKRTGQCPQEKSRHSRRSCGHRSRTIQ